MNNEEKKEHGILEAWLKTDAKWDENNLEAAIMDKVIQRNAIAPFKESTASAYINKIVAVYIILVIMSFAFCFWSGDFTLFVNVPEHYVQSIVEDKLISYYLLTSALLSSLCLLTYRLQSRRANTRELNLN